MATNFPASIDTTTTLPTVIDLTTPAAASSINILRDAVLAVETALGVNPANTYGNVRARLDGFDSALSILNSTSAQGDVSGLLFGLLTVIKLQNNPVSATVPTIGQVLAWNGAVWIPTAASGGLGAGNVRVISTVKTSNYITNSTDDVIICNTTSGAITITIIASPVAGQRYTVTDVGNAADTKFITVLLGGSKTFVDGRTQYVINNKGSSLTIFYNGTTWSIESIY